MLDGLPQDSLLAIREIISREGLEAIDIKYFLVSGKPVLRCLIDYPKGGVNIDSCALVNRKIFSFLEESNILGDDFVVEVHSPGLDRPLKNKKDFLRIKGGRILVWLKNNINNRNYYEGEVIDATDNGIVLKLKDSQLDISFCEISLCKEDIR